MCNHYSWWWAITLNPLEALLSQIGSLTCIPLVLMSQLGSNISGMLFIAHTPRAKPLCPQRGSLCPHPPVCHHFCVIWAHPLFWKLHGFCTGQVWEKYKLFPFFLMWQLWDRAVFDLPHHIADIWHSWVFWAQIFWMSGQCPINTGCLLLFAGHKCVGEAIKLLCRLGTEECCSICIWKHLS